MTLHELLKRLAKGYDVPHPDVLLSGQYNKLVIDETMKAGSSEEYRKYTHLLLLANPTLLSWAYRDGEAIFSVVFHKRRMMFYLKEAGGFSNKGFSGIVWVKMGIGDFRTKAKYGWTKKCILEQDVKKRKAAPSVVVASGRMLLFGAPKTIHSCPTPVICNVDNDNTYTFIGEYKYNVVKSPSMTYVMLDNGIYLHPYSIAMVSAELEKDKDFLLKNITTLPIYAIRSYDSPANVAIRLRASLKVSEVGNQAADKIRVIYMDTLPTDLTKEILTRMVTNELTKPKEYK